jgi:hypothetical protein
MLRDGKQNFKRLLATMETLKENGLNLIYGSIKTTTVKPMYNGHPWDSKKVAVVQK